jgi:hypothetical protein
MRLNKRALLALAIVAGVMCALLFGTAGTTRYWQAWVYVSMFVGASGQTTLYLMKRDPVLLARRMRGGPDVREGSQVQRRMLESWYSPESLRRALAAQGSSFFVAESSGDVIGFA